MEIVRAFIERRKHKQELLNFADNLWQRYMNGQVNDSQFKAETDKFKGTPDYMPLFYRMNENLHATILGAIDQQLTE